tara:strand:- start:268 stop:480 length:213 start_codon:yes stop_codon:yes gene_type:complete
LGTGLIGFSEFGITLGSDMLSSLIICPQRINLFAGRYQKFKFNSNGKKLKWGRGDPRTRSIKYGLMRNSV